MIDIGNRLLILICRLMNLNRALLSATVILP
jgi:hypothetical protein